MLIGRSGDEATNQSDRDEVESQSHKLVLLDHRKDNNAIICTTIVHQPKYIIMTVVALFTRVL